MSNMITDSKTIYEVLKKINKNAYVMPAFQRNYVWDLDRIEKLWDSILQGYPFSTFLFWELDEQHITPSNFFYIFSRECCFNSNGDNDGCEYDRNNINFADENHPTIAVLDGQQRLTSLFLSLYGDVYKRPKSAKKKKGTRYCLKLFIELDKSKIDENNAFNSKKYSVFFSEKVVEQSPSKFEVRRILNEEFKDKDSTRPLAIEEVVEKIPELQKDYARGILNRLCEAIYDQKLITFTKVSDLYQDDALEMFVRFNSGGKNLTKAQISMSILEVFWPNVQKDFNSVLVGKFANFGTDFILRTGHMIYGDVVKSNIDQNFALTFKANFETFKEALKETADLFEMMHYDISRFSSRWNVIIPIIYLIYNNKTNYIDSIQGIFAYLFRSILFQYYASGTTGKLQAMKSLIYQNGFKLTPDMFDNVADMRLTDAKIDELLLAEKGSMTAGNILYCLGLNHIDDSYDYDEDHIHPDARFERQQPLTMKATDWTLARNLHNKMPNLQLLRSDLNESKGDQDFDVYYVYLNPVEKTRMKTQGYIPEPSVGMSEADYYKIDNFLNFYEDRKKLLHDKLKTLLNGNA